MTGLLYRRNTQARRRYRRRRLALGIAIVGTALAALLFPPNEKTPLWSLGIMGELSRSRN